jgi:hypothetical protein
MGHAELKRDRPRLSLGPEDFLGARGFPGGPGISWDVTSTAGMGQVNWVMKRPVQRLEAGLMRARR